jgi:hypothetical protein
MRRWITGARRAGLGSGGTAGTRLRGRSAHQLMTEQGGGFELLRSDCAPATRHAPLIRLLNAKPMW